MPYPSNDSPETLDDDQSDSLRVSAAELRAFVTRIEKIDELIDDHRQDRKEVVAEAKARGYDPAVLRAIVSRRKKDPEKLSEHEAIMQLYLEVLGDI